MKDLKKLFENKHVRKVEKFRRLIDNYVYKSFYHLEISLIQLDKMLSPIKPKEESKEPILTIVK